MGYKQIIYFVENAEWKIFGKKMHPRLGGVDLRAYLEKFVKETFIPNMQAEAYYEMGQVLLDNQPMDQIRLIDEPLLLLKSTAGIFDLIKKLFEHYELLPVFDSKEFVNMIQKILSNFGDTYQSAMDEISEILISKNLIYSKNAYIDILTAYDLRHLFEESEENEVRDRHSAIYQNKNKDSEERRIDADKYSYARMKEKHSDIPLAHFLNDAKRQNQPIRTMKSQTFNSEYYSKLALISTGLFW